MPDDNKLTFGDVASRNILRVSTYESEVKRYSSKVGISEFLIGTFDFMQCFRIFM